MAMLRKRKAVRAGGGRSGGVQGCTGRPRSCRAIVPTTWRGLGPPEPPPQELLPDLQTAARRCETLRIGQAVSRRGLGRALLNVSLQVHSRPVELAQGGGEGVCLPTSEHRRLSPHNRGLRRSAEWLAHRMSARSTAPSAASANSFGRHVRGHGTGCARRPPGWSGPGGCAELAVQRLPGGRWEQSHLEGQFGMLRRPPAAVPRARRGELARCKLTGN